MDRDACGMMGIMIKWALHGQQPAPDIKSVSFDWCYNKMSSAGRPRKLSCVDNCCICTKKHVLGTSTIYMAITDTLPLDELPSLIIHICEISRRRAFRWRQSCSKLVPRFCRFILNRRENVIHFVSAPGGMSQIPP
jgi:hypothetical protein